MYSLSYNNYMIACGQPDTRTLSSGADKVKGRRIADRAMSGVDVCGVRWLLAGANLLMYESALLQHG